MAFTIVGIRGLLGEKEQVVTLNERVETLVEGAHRVARGTAYNGYGAERKEYPVDDACGEVDDGGAQTLAKDLLDPRQCLVDFAMRHLFV